MYLEKINSKNSIYSLGEKKSKRKSVKKMKKNSLDIHTKTFY